MRRWLISWLRGCKERNWAIMVEDGNVEMSLEDLIPYIILLRCSSRRCDPVNQNVNLNTT